jgi:hypothetical protein
MNFGINIIIFFSFWKISTNNAVEEASGISK